MKAEEDLKAAVQETKNEAAIVAQKKAEEDKKAAKEKAKND